MTVKYVQPDHPVHELVAARWSPYAWADRSVDDSDLAALFEAARWAASSYNEQPWRWIVAHSKNPDAHAQLLSTLVEGNQAWARNAPVLAIGLTATTFSRNGKPNKAAHHDLGLAAGNLCFEATARGLAVHQMIGIEPERVREVYGVPTEMEPLTGLAIGYAGEAASLPESLRERDLAPRSRKRLSELVFEERWGRSASFLE